MNLMIDAHESEDVTTNLEAARYLSSIGEFSSATGRARMQKNGIVWTEAVVKTIEDGKPVVLER